MDKSKKFCFSGNIGIMDRCEIEWLEDQWDFMLGDDVSWPHYCPDQLIEELETYKRTGHRNLVSRAIFLPKS